MAGLGYAAWLPLTRPETRPAIADLREAEAAAQRLYQIASGEVTS